MAEAWNADWRTFCVERIVLSSAAASFVPSELLHSCKGFVVQIPYSGYRVNGLSRVVHLVVRVCAQTF